MGVKCPVCGGYLWTEYVLTDGGWYSSSIKKVGIDVVCIGGHRFALTPIDYKLYRWKKKYFFKKGGKNDCVCCE